MRNLSYKMGYWVFIFLVFGVASSISANEATKSDGAISVQLPPALADVISKLSNNQTFYMNRLSADMLFAQYCTKASEKKFKNFVTVKYACDSKFGFSSVKLHSVEQEGHKNYLMYLHVDFPYQYFSPAKNLMVKYLGREKKISKDSARWGYGSDIYLNELGNPVIYVNRDKEINTATFAVVLEQGDGER